MTDEPEDPPDPEPEKQNGESSANSSPAKPEKTGSPWLKPYHFKPGQSGNPSGRPKHVSSGYEEMLETRINKKMVKALKLPEDFQGLTFREALVFGIGGAAARGTTEAAREIADRLEGKVESSMKITAATSMEEILRKLAEKKMGSFRPSIDTTTTMPELEAGEIPEEGESDE